MVWITQLRSNRINALTGLGGGYVMSCSLGHFAWLFDLQNELSKTQNISVVVVGYTLAPHGQYPTQLKQAAESLEWLLNTHNKKPGDVSLTQKRVKDQLLIQP